MKKCAEHTVCPGAGGTEDVLRRFLRSFESCPAAMLGAWEPLHLPSAQRLSTLVSLQSAVKACCSCHHREAAIRHFCIVWGPGSGPVCCLVLDSGGQRAIERLACVTLRRCTLGLCALLTKDQGGLLLHARVLSDNAATAPLFSQYAGQSHIDSCAGSDQIILIRRLVNICKTSGNIHGMAGSV